DLRWGLVMSEFSANPSPNNPLQSCYGSLDDALISLCDHVEALATSSIAGLTICDPSRTRIQRAIFPRLPQYAASIVEIPLSPSNFGSCVQAVTLGEVITCPDIAEEKRFEPQWQRLGLDHSIRSLQSRPFYLREGKPYGTFVLAFRQPRKETDWDVALMKFAADAAGLIIQSDLDRTNIAAE
ncbi:MAG: GAF domain-containing protein, partial [Pseudolabrys sp.]